MADLVAKEERKPDSLDFEESHFSEYIVCRSLIDFELPDNLPWRGNDKENETTRLSISHMLTDILCFYKKWLAVKTTLDESVISKAKEAMLTNFIYHVNVEEGVGTQELDHTKRILNERRENRGPKRVKRMESKNEKETQNIYAAYEALEKFSKKELESDRSLVCLMEMDNCIKDIHKILMEDVLSSDKTQGGIFSTSVRYTDYRGKRHQYPHYESQMEWEAIIGGLLDNYNGLIEETKKDIRRKKGENRTEAILDLFKLAGWFLYKLVSLHPFSDGNGRLCRLLASYVLGLISPFPSPIYNVYSSTQKSDYLDAIYECREEKLDKPGYLTLIMLESNWAAWKIFLQTLEDDVSNENTCQS